MPGRYVGLPPAGFSVQGQKQHVRLQSDLEPVLGLAAAIRPTKTYCISCLGWSQGVNRSRSVAGAMLLPSDMRLELHVTCNLGIELHLS